jgi:hypothetical protein
VGAAFAPVVTSRVHGRVLTPGLALLDTAARPADMAPRSPLARAWRQLDKTLDEFIRHPDDRGLKLDLTVNFALGKSN